MVLNYGTQLAASLFQAVLSLLQTTFLLKWAARSCAGTKYVFKIDDDVFVNSDKMWLLLGKGEFRCMKVANFRLTSILLEEDR
jgi:hypothetical protein